MSYQLHICKSNYIVISIQITFVSNSQKNRTESLLRKRRYERIHKAKRTQRRAITTRSSWLTLRHAGSGRRARYTSILLCAGEYLVALTVG